MGSKIKAIASIVLLVAGLVWFADQQGLFDYFASAPAPAAPPAVAAADAKPPAAAAPVVRDAPEVKGSADRAAIDPLQPAGGEPGDPAAAPPAAPRSADMPVPVPAPAARMPDLPAAPLGDPAYRAHAERIRSLQMEVAVDALEAALLTSKANIAEAKAKIARSEREARAAAEVSILPPVPPPAALRPAPGAPAAGAADPVAPEPAIPAFAVLAVRQSVDGDYGATVRMDGQRFDVRIGSTLADGWTVGSIDERGVRFDRPAAGKRRAATRTVPFAFGTSTAEAVPALPTLPIGAQPVRVFPPPPGTASPNPVPGTPIPGMPGALVPQPVGAEP